MVMKKKHKPKNVTVTEVHGMRVLYRHEIQTSYRVFLIYDVCVCVFVTSVFLNKSITELKYSGTLNMQQHTPELHRRWLTC